MSDQPAASSSSESVIRLEEGQKVKIRSGKAHKAQLPYRTVVIELDKHRPAPSDGGGEGQANEGNDGSKGGAEPYPLIPYVLTFKDAKQTKRYGFLNEKGKSVEYRCPLEDFTVEFPFGTFDDPPGFEWDDEELDLEEPVGAYVEVQVESSSWESSSQSLTVCLPVDPAAPDSQDDRYTLRARDGSWSATKTIKDDAVEGDKKLTLVFEGVDPEKEYDLEIDPGNGFRPYVALSGYRPTP